MTFTVTRSTGVIVQPSESTPSGTLNLSVIDRLPNLRLNVQTLHVFRHGHETARVIREALSKALVPYYPLAGRLKESPYGDLQIYCSGEGVWFVDAFTDCSLESVKYLDNVPMIPNDNLLPTPPPETCSLDPLVQIQVTHFTCEGFVIGVTFCHSVCDGLGAAQFLNTVGEFARGFTHHRTLPVWHRETIPAPAWLAHALREPKLSLPPPSPLSPSDQLEHASFDISIDQIYWLKNEFLELTGKYCSTFDVVAASLWRHRTRAIRLETDTSVKLVFFANTRQFLDPPLPEGFYGNCFFPVTVTISSGWLVEASNAQAVKLIREAKARLPTTFRNWLKNDQLDDSEDAFASPLEYTTLFISEWSRLGFNQIDYGWGHPLHVLPIQASSIMPVSLVGSPPTPKKGTRLMTWCVHSAHLPSFLDQMMNQS
ncbi:hypothetical protein IFM89_018612 [Coptis chinensis]|uniref:Uncharacterized protein n=1 Tax=Coptis chinensis TaxID=261450 RepID=A0A835H5B1_9MAGN|nr:hypothetical protein IFM89_018612 [Coptis chinensis]